MSKRFKYLTFITTLLIISTYVPNVFAELTIGNYSLQSKERAGRTQYAYTYKADITNTGEAVTNATSIVSSLSSKTKVTVKDLTFGDVGAGKTVTSSDSFTITQDRRTAFNPDDLVWEVTAEPSVGNLPPDPGEAGKATLEGIDSDNDGVRDDIQRYIALTYPDSEKIRMALRQSAKIYQKTLIDSISIDASYIISIQSEKSTACLFYVYDPDDNGSAINKIFNAELALRAEYLNTENRFRAYMRYDSHLAGKVYDITLAKNRKNMCEIDPESLEN